MKTLEILNVLFYSILFFVTVNTLLSLLLWNYRRTKLYGLTFLFWLVNGVNLGFQFLYPQTKEEIAMVYGIGVFPMIIAYSIVCELIKIKAKYFLFILTTIFSLVLTSIFLYFGVPFTLSALPFAITLALPLIVAMKHIFIDKRHESSMLDRILGGILGLWVIHCFNFAFFRMDPDAPVYGWITAYALYDLLAIILPATVIVNQTRTERERLRLLVEERTSELSIALDDKENLLKILIHDISTPLTVMRWYLTGLKKADDPNKYIDKIIKSQEIVESIVKKVRKLHLDPKAQKIAQTSLLKCIEEIHFIFEKTLEQKGLQFLVTDHTKGNDLFMTDSFTFTHHILSNIISNAIKFSYPKGVINLSISREGHYLQLSIQDQGKGMNQQTIDEILSNSITSSHQGTQGEVGTGLGLGIVTSMLTHFKGSISIKSKEFSDEVSDHGTTITLLLPIP